MKLILIWSIILIFASRWLYLHPAWLIIVVPVGGLILLGGLITGFVNCIVPDTKPR